MPKELPKNWIKTSLDDIAKWSSGGTPSRKVVKYYGGNIPWFKTGDLNNGILLEASEYLTTDGIKNSSAKIFPSGSIGIAMYGATIGKTGEFGIDAATNQACAVGIPLGGISSKFLHYFLKVEKSKFINKAKGGAQPNISQTIIKRHSINLPPLAEQERIVAKLDDLFARLDNIKSSLDKIPTLLKNFRQQVLTQAVTGELTKEWREGKDLEEWKKYNVDQFITEIKDKVNPKDIDPVDYVGLEHIAKNGGIINKGTSDKIKSNKTVFRAGDVLYGKLRPYLNKHDVVDFDGICSTDILVYRSNNRYASKFFNYYLGTNSIINKLNAESKGINLPRVSAKTLNKFKIICPPNEELKEIVNRVESLFTKADVIQQKYEVLKAKIDQLPQAILHKAFKGELVPQLETDGDARDLLIEIEELKKQATKTKKPSKTTKIKKYKSPTTKLSKAAEHEDDYK